MEGDRRLMPEGPRGPSEVGEEAGTGLTSPLPPSPPPSLSPRGGPGSRSSPRLPRRVQFSLPHTSIPAPAPQQEERAFYRRLEHLMGPNGSFQALWEAGDWEDLAEGKCLRKCLVKQGHGSRPQAGQEMAVKLLGALEDGSLVERDPRLTFVLGQWEAIQALELAVPSMQVGEVALFLVSPTCAYGSLGREPDIPPNATLLYEVTLLQVQDGPNPALLTASERFGLCNRRREWGNFHFEREDFQRALRCYQEALQLLLLPGEGTLSPEEEEEQRDLELKCLNNSAAAQMKLQQPEEALGSCDRVLQLDPDNVKALFRKGKLLSEQGEDQAAMAVLKRALHLDPATKTIHAELSKLARKQREQKGSSPALQEDSPATPGAHGPQPEVSAP
ncbi:peptidyl-prolyl cis-trans isomerase FKBP8 isoform X2 [Anolis carolinensis]|uniref:peptidylprolyl isomerase n=1 Tax=Anolis carolinensis TaxID=28377 RepID=H9G9L0_ANOCA